MRYTEESLCRLRQVDLREAQASRVWYSLDNCLFELLRTVRTKDFVLKEINTGEAGNGKTQGLERR